MADEMFFSPDSLSLRRGRRVAKRTPTSRPCVIWPKDARELEVQGLVLDINPYGMLVRIGETFSVGTVVCIQLMRDDGRKEALSTPLEGVVIRHGKRQGGQMDHGIKVEQKELEREATPAVRANTRPQSSTSNRTRMHTIDITVSDNGIRRSR
ncbi:MAG: hypothetical protein RBU21_05200 [FCB group bacterium]|jgi:hypothetical protein|nr:hypothetical protein [FCB group bacterium]